jgi:ABC-2 type transport system permease protein
LLDARQNGTLEYLLVSQTSLPVILMGWVIYLFALLSVRTLVYLGWGILVCGFPTAQANWAAAALVLAVSVLAFIVGRAVSKLYAGLQTPQSGEVVLPRSGRFDERDHVSDRVLPAPLQWAARLIPVTYSLEAMRGALLGHASLGDLWPAIRALLPFAPVLLPSSLAAFAWALRRIKVTGTLIHF